MTTPEITPEELAAFADGEIDGARSAEIAVAVAASPEMQAQVAAHRALRDQLSAHFAPIAEEPVPDHLAAMLRPAAANDQIEAGESSAEIVSFDAARKKAAAKRTLPRWSWVAGPAIAATLVLAVFVPGGGDDPANNPYAETQLAAALDTQLVAEQGAQAETRILLSFRNEGGEYCRAFSNADSGGIACRDASGWRLEAQGAGSAASGTEFRQAGAAEIMAQAQDMASGDALDAEAEAAAREAGWQQ